jgi:hypothetical protein
MQSNAMKKCAVSAMLFGGTLGAASTAQAGVTINSANVYQAFAGSGTVIYQSNYGAFNTSGGTFNTVLPGFIGAGSTAPGSFTFSPFTSAGFSASAQTAGSWLGLDLFNVTFTVSGSTPYDLNLSGLAPVGAPAGQGNTTSLPGVSLSLFSGSSASGTALQSASFSNQSYSQTWALSAGTYTLRTNMQSGINWNSRTGPAYDGTYLNASFVAVPAPGAAALVGVAGLVGMRRRKA